jgi:hypothetical protein
MTSWESPDSKPLTHAELMHKLAKAGPSPIKLRDQDALLAILDELALRKGLTPAQRADKLWVAFGQVASSARKAVLAARRKQRLEQERRAHGVKHTRSSRNITIASGNPKEKLIAQEAEQAQIAAAGELLDLSDDRDLVEMLGADNVSHYRQIVEKCPTNLEVRKVRASVWFGGAIYADLAERKAVEYWWPAFLGAVERQLMIDRLNNSTSPAIDRNTVRPSPNNPDPQFECLPLSAPLREILDARRQLCAAQKRAFYTSDLLLALFELPNGVVWQLCEEVKKGLAADLYEWSLVTLARTPRERFDPFEPFDWMGMEREDDSFAVAQQLASEDGARVVRDVHLFLALLDSTSETQARLARHLTPAQFDRLRNIAASKRRSTRSILKTPEPE